ncbi:MAG: rod shape-determining protein RodA [Coriobacteriales bacterium]|nr:rod shape-determining protein RodA [Coriobacteriales bacterium]
MSATSASSSIFGIDIKGFFSNLDRMLLIVVTCLVTFGLIAVYSASLTIEEASFSRQLLGVALGGILAVILASFDYRLLEPYAIAFFVIDCVLILLPLVPGLSYSANGITGWVRVPLVGLTFQTSELAKLVTIILMSSLAARYKGRIPSLGEYIKLCVMLSVPFLLIFLQPDLGTGLVFFVSGAAVIILAGPKRSWVIVTIVLVVILVALIIGTDQFIDARWGDSRSLIKDYQINRLMVFLDPDSDTTGSGYNIKQAMIAVGSGGFLGKGIGNASQAVGGFLPAAHTDFIFALISEEFGFVGAMLLILLFTWLIFSALRIARHCDNLFGKLLVGGIVVMWTFQTFENIGMCLSLMPITGIPLPFISFGSSSMIAQMLFVGLVQSVAVHRTKVT